MRLPWWYILEGARAYGQPMPDRVKGRMLRVLHCPTLSGRNPQGLCAAERRLGLDSKCVSIEPSQFYGRAPDGTAWSPGDGLGKVLLEWIRLVKLAYWADVIHYNAGETLVPRSGVRSSKGFPMERMLRIMVRFFEQRDMVALKKLGKRIVVTFQGDDARLESVARAHGDARAFDENKELCDSGAEANRKRRIERFDRYADHIFAVNPDLLYALPKRAQYVQYASVDALNVDPVYRTGPAHVPIIAHAPSTKATKGTRFISDAVYSLQSEGLRCEYDLITGENNKEALSRIARCDLFVDQLLLGFYGGVAVEAWALGKPVVCYLNRDDLNLIPFKQTTDLLGAIIEAGPATIKDVLRTCILNRRNELVSQGMRGREYVKAWHNPLIIASRMKDAYEDRC